MAQQISFCVRHARNPPIEGCRNELKIDRRRHDYGESSNPAIHRGFRQQCDR